MEMKIEAVKKMYAEMILNTSKEASKRVMLAEHKAFGFQKELGFLKEESARIMLHLNRTFTSQIEEAEARSLNQQKKIDDLEAQLGEAEEIIVDLREELKQVQDKLEILSHCQRRASYGYIAGIDQPVLKCLTQDDELYSLNESKVSDAKAALQDRSIEVMSHNPIARSSELSHVTDPYNLSVEPAGPHLICVHARHSDATSDIIQNREADLSINGCSLRICAFGGKLLNMKVPTLSVNGQHSLAKARNKIQDPVTEKSYIVRNIGKTPEEPCSVCSSVTDMKSSSKTENELEGHLLYPGSWQRGQGVRTLRRSPGKNAKYREAIASLQGKPDKMYRRSRKSPLVSQLKACSSGQKVRSVEKPTKANIFCESVSNDLSPKIEIVNIFTTVHPGGQVDTLASGENGNSKETTKVLSNKRFPVSGDGLGELELVDVPIAEGFIQAANVRIKKQRKNALNKIDENIMTEMNHGKGRLVKPTDVSVIESC